MTSNFRITSRQKGTELLFKQSTVIYSNIYIYIKNTNPLLLEQIEPPVSFGVEGSSNRRPRRHISAETRP